MKARGVMKRDNRTGYNRSLKIIGEEKLNVSSFLLEGINIFGKIE